MTSDYEDEELQDLEIAGTVQNYVDSKNDIEVSFKLSSDRINDSVDAVIRNEVREALARESRRSISDLIHGAVNEALKPAVQEALQQKIHAERDYAGNPKGQGVTLLEYVYKRAEDAMNEHVDRNGMVVDLKTDSHWKSDRAEPRIAFMLRQICSNEIEKSVRKEAQKVYDAAKKAATDQATKAFSEMIVKLNEGKRP